MYIKYKTINLYEYFRIGGDLNSLDLSQTRIKNSAVPIREIKENSDGTFKVTNFNGVVLNYLPLEIEITLKYY